MCGNGYVFVESQYDNVKEECEKLKRENLELKLKIARLEGVIEGLNKQMIYIPCSPNDTASLPKFPWTQDWYCTSGNV